MKLIAEIAGGEEHVLEVRRGEGAHVSARVDERAYELEAHELEANVYLLLVGGRVYECHVDTAGTSADAPSVHINNRTYSVALRDPKRLGGARNSAAKASGRVSVTAPMPGKVVRVLVTQGSEVRAGDGLVIVEAMKMQNEMKSPKDGTVVELHAQPGTTVNAGDALVVIE